MTWPRRLVVLLRRPAGVGSHSHSTEVGVIRMSLLLLSALASGAPVPASAATSPPGAAGKVFISSCTVMFALKSSWGSSTRPGFGDNRSERVEVSVSREFNIAGHDSTAFQRITDAICGAAPAELAAAGFEVVTEGVRDHYAYQRALKSAQESPQRQGRSGSAYLAFAPSGQKIMDGFVVGVTNSAGIISGEVTVGAKLGANPVALLYSVDFADIEGSRTGRGVRQDQARVTAELQVSVGLTVTTYDVSGARCATGSPFGEYRGLEFCNLRNGNAPYEGTYSIPDSLEMRTRAPIISVEENTSTASRVGTSVFNAAMAVASMGGGGGGGFVNAKRFEVRVDSVKYEQSAIEGARGLIAPAMRWITEPESRPRGRRGRR